MARSNDIQYVRFYTYGSAAAKAELPEKKTSLPKPKAAKAHAPVVRLDGLAVVGVAVAVIMLVCMAVGFIQLRMAEAEVADLQAYVSQLEVQNDAMRTQYEHGYDIDEIQSAAVSMGMIPAEQAQHITVSVPEPVEVVELTWWQALLEQVQAFFA